MVIDDEDESEGMFMIDGGGEVQEGRLTWVVVGVAVFGGLIGRAWVRGRGGRKKEKVEREEAVENA